MDFKLQSEEGDIATFIENGEWDLLGRHTVTTRSSLAYLHSEV